MLDTRLSFFKQNTAYELRISDWSADVCSSDLQAGADACHGQAVRGHGLPGVADALAKNEAGHKCGDAGVDVHHRTTCEIERAHAEEDAVACPYHVRDREIDNRQPDDAEDHCGREFQPLDDVAQNQCGGNRSEGHLETTEHILGNEEIG